eukprot:4502466-Amphidinium_carterae.1
MSSNWYKKAIGSLRYPQLSRVQCKTFHKVRPAVPPVICLQTLSSFAQSPSCAPHSQNRYVIYRDVTILPNNLSKV